VEIGATSASTFLNPAPSETEKVCLELGLTQVELAGLLGVTDWAIKHREAGTREPIPLAVQHLMRQFSHWSSSPSPS
jgi:predicted transcriptional regulator